MKKLFTLFAMCIAFATADAQVNYTTRTLTFEDNDYVGGTANYLGNTTDYWSSLIDSPQYGGDLLYGENHGDTAHVYTSVNYQWYDKGNTFLRSELPTNWGTTMYWGGGHAISNYWDGNLNNGDYMHQLSVYVANNSANGQDGHGHNGSNNFCVHYGYVDNSGYSAENLPAWRFGDGNPRYIESMWINNTTYAVNCMLNGNGLTDPLESGSYLNIEAYGYRGGRHVYTKTFPLVDDNGNVITEWTKWDWNAEGNTPVSRVEFNMVSDIENNYGLSLPAYFAYDDVTVSESTTNNAPARIKKAAESDTKTFEVRVDMDFDADDNFLGFIPVVTGEAPAGVAYEYTSDSETATQLEKAGQKAKLLISNIPDGIQIEAISAKVGTAATQRGAGAMTAFVDDNKVGTIRWRAKSMKNITNDYGTPVGSNDIQDFELSSPVTCHNTIAFETENIKIEEKASLSGTINMLGYIISYTTGSTTGINDIKTSASNDAIYNLQGIRVDNPVKGSIYIKGGKKIAY